MEYYRTDDGQIQADLAKRLGVVLKQYHEQVSSNEKYEVSLCLSILQTLLTNCVELLDGLKGGQRRNDPFYSLQLSIWGLDEKNVLFNNFSYPALTPEIIVRNIRNALSHPTKINLNSNRPTTGYSTVGETEKIESIVFITSPDINQKGNLKTYSSVEFAQKAMKNGNSYFPENIKILLTQDKKTYAFFHNDEPFYRVFKIVLTPENLRTLTYSLANYLSHPLDKKWDGKTFTIQTLAA